MRFRVGDKVVVVNGYGPVKPGMIGFVVSRTEVVDGFFCRFPGWSGGDSGICSDERGKFYNGREMHWLPPQCLSEYFLATTEEIGNEKKRR
jgi:hypothetical protein